MYQRPLFLILTLLSIAAFGACRSLDRAHPESALLVAELSFAGGTPGKFNFLRDFFAPPRPRGQLYIVRVPREDSPPIRATHGKDSTYIFSNVTPGHYRLFKLIIPEAGPGVRNELGTISSLRSTVVTWRGAAADTSMTEALAGVAGYMGAYSIRIRSRNVSDVSGVRDAAGEQRALQGIVEHWGGEWPQQIRLQMLTSY